mmetsp:Transcript_25535/g.46458  ORF Transcript_25535/g.46458 Transcript_25535/m.46458 type:complete len:1018 (-) Transcript_25535:715-3768(-)
MKIRRDKSYNPASLIKEIGCSCTFDENTFKNTVLFKCHDLHERSIAEVIYIISKHITDKLVPRLPKFCLVKNSPFKALFASNWNIISVINCINESYEGLNWVDVANCLDFDDFVVQDLQCFIAITEIFKLATKKQFPVHVVLKKVWKNVKGQLSMLRFAALSSPEQFSFDETRRLFDTATDDPPFPWKPKLWNNQIKQAYYSIEFYHILCLISESPIRGISSECKELLQYPIQHCPELVLVGMASSLVKQRNPLIQETFSSLIPSLVSSYASEQHEIVQFLFQTNPTLMEDTFTDLLNMKDVKHYSPNFMMNVLNTLHRLGNVTSVLRRLRRFPTNLEAGLLAAKLGILDFDTWLEDEHRDEAFAFNALQYIFDALNHVSSLHFQKGPHAMKIDNTLLASSQIKSLLALAQRHHLHPSTSNDPSYPHHHLHHHQHPHQTQYHSRCHQHHRSGSNSSHSALNSNNPNISNDVDSDSLKLDLIQMVEEAASRLFPDFSPAPIPPLDLPVAASTVVACKEHEDFATKTEAKAGGFDALPDTHCGPIPDFNSDSDKRSSISDSMSSCTLAPNTSPSPPPPSLHHPRHPRPHQHISSAGSKHPPLVSNAADVHSSLNPHSRPLYPPTRLVGVDVQIPCPRDSSQPDEICRTFSPTDSLDSAVQKCRSSYRQPAVSVSDRIHFLVNNLTLSTVASKSHEIRGKIVSEFVDWFAHYIVAQRGAHEPNLHPLYLRLLEEMDIPGMHKRVISTTVLYIKVLLYGERIIKESNDRSLLKNLGSWLGLLTFAYSKPLLSKDLELKTIVCEAYQRGRLMSVLPFIQKLLEGCKDSKVYRPANPMIAGILSVLAELHSMKDLKINNMFSIELIFRDFGLKPGDVAPDDILRTLSRENRVNPDWSVSLDQGETKGGGAQGFFGSTGMGSTFWRSDGASALLPSSDRRSSSPSLPVGSSGGGGSSSSSGGGGGIGKGSVIADSYATNIYTSINTNSNTTATATATTLSVIVTVTVGVAVDDRRHRSRSSSSH